MATTPTAIRKPTRLDFSAERFAIGDTAAAVRKQNDFSTEMEGFSRQINDEMIPDIENVTQAAIAAASSAASSASEASSAATTATAAAATVADAGQHVATAMAAAQDAQAALAEAASANQTALQNSQIVIQAAGETKNYRDETVAARDEATKAAQLLTNKGGMIDTLMDLRDAPITLQPAFSDPVQAANWRHAIPTEASQYSTVHEGFPTTSYADLFMRMPGSFDWWSEPKQALFGNKISVLACIGVGSAPHPIPKPAAQIGVFCNLDGMHLNRYWEAIKENLKIFGQSYGITNYDDMLAIAENIDSPLSVGTDRLRIVNLGSTPIHIKGLWIIRHLL